MAEGHARVAMAGIVLAAGSSTRLGQPKQTLPFGDTTLLGWVMRNAERSTLDRVIVVVGARAKDVLSGVRANRAQVVVNESYSTGSASSLQKGLAVIGECEAAMLLLGDMPEVDDRLINTLREMWAAYKPWAAVTSYRGELAHPLLVSAAAFAAIRSLRGDKALWRMLGSHREDVHQLEVDRPRPTDVDEWSDYIRARDRLRLGDGSFVLEERHLEGLGGFGVENPDSKTRPKTKSGGSGHLGLPDTQIQ